MYYSITGKVIFFEEGRIVVDCNNIGFDILVSNNTLNAFGHIGETITIFTCVKIADDVIKIYGFSTKEEKAMFIKLTSISGVGPKTALQILSGIDPKTLALNIVNSDYKALAKIKGIGKKTAMRIIMELKEKLEEEDFESLSDTPIPKIDDPISQDAILALSSLGMSKSEATRQVSLYRPKANTTEELISLVFRSMK